MEEHRRHPRHRTLKAGKIIFNHHLSVIDCTIRNLSDTGACLQIPATVGVPDRFELWFEAEKRTRPCRVAWKTATRVGVAFD
jgi:PilZ domain-containing protein